MAGLRRVLGNIWADDGGIASVEYAVLLGVI